MQDLLADLLKQATRRGATAADAFVVEDQSFSAQVRLGQVDTVKHAREQHMALRVFVGKSVAAASTPGNVASSSSIGPTRGARSSKS